MKESQHALILGAATGYQPNQVSNFVETLKQSGFAGTTALLVDRSNTTLREYLAENGIETILLNCPTRWMPNWFAERRFNSGRMRFVHKAVALAALYIPTSLATAYYVQIVSLFHHIMDNRHFHYLNFLEANADRFSHVLLSDVRDVVFQSDPFEDVPAEFLWLFQESSSVKLGNEPCNRWWVEAAYGAENARKIHDNYVLCAGTTMGSYSLISTYLQQMTAELTRLTPKICGMAGFDQGAHNFLHGTGAFPRAEVKQNFAGPVATLQLESSDRFQFDHKSRLLNDDGRLVPILHQYDRHPILARHFDSR